MVSSRLRIKQLGFTLLEAMISLSLGFILIALMAAIFDIYTKQQLHLYYNQLALIQKHNLIDMLSVDCDENVISYWNKQNAKMLPKGDGSVSGRYPNIIISIYWRDAISSVT